MLAGAVALVITRCLSMEDAYRAVEWRVVVLIAGMLPIGAALAATGLADRIGGLFTGELGAAGPLALIAGLYLFTVALTQFVGGQVAALIVGPLAISAALSLQVDPAAVGVAVALGCSVAFLTPLAHPVNVLMMGPGGYSFRDFARVGAGLALVCLLCYWLGCALFGVSAGSVFGTPPPCPPLLCEGERGQGVRENQLSGTRSSTVVPSFSTVRDAPGLAAD